MIVCVCHRVSDRDISRAVHQGGCTRFEDLQASLGVATTCGTCHDCARQAFEAQVASLLAAGRAASTGTGGPDAPAPGEASASMAQAMSAPALCPPAVASTDGQMIRHGVDDPAVRWRPKRGTRTRCQPGASSTEG